MITTTIYNGYCFSKEVEILIYKISCKVKKASINKHALLIFLFEPSVIHIDVSDRVILIAE